MKSQSLKLFAIAFVLGLVTLFASAGTASAQTKLMFETPFDFHVGKNKFSAGKYEVLKMAYGRYLLKNTETKNAEIVAFNLATGNINKADAETIVFNRYGETYFLRSLYDVRREAGKLLTESKFEREIRREFESRNNRLADKKKEREAVSIRLTR